LEIWLSLATTLLSRLLKPAIPGPRGWRITPVLTGLSCPFKLADPRVDGKLGTGGTPPNPLTLEKREPNPADTRREEAMVA
jgi:hypothetical protein